MKVLFVCMSNICRSPALEAVLRAEAARRHLLVTVDSCGVGWLHLGEPPDSRMAAAARRRAVTFTHSAQEFEDRFFDEFDLILAVDQDILEQLKRHANTPEQLGKVYLATTFSKKFQGQEVPDPYYLGATGFDHVMDMAEDIAAGILDSRVCIDSD